MYSLTPQEEENYANNSILEVFDTEIVRYSDVSVQIHQISTPISTLFALRTGVDHLSDAYSAGYRFTRAGKEIVYCSFAYLDNREAFKSGVIDALGDIYRCQTKGAI